MKIAKIFSIVAIGFACSLSGANIEPQCATLPFSKANYYHFARDQNLAELIRDFFVMQGITVVVSDKVRNVVNGRFSRMDPLDFWNYITKAYGLVWFFDGRIMFVYANSELRTQIFRMDIDSIETLSAILVRLGFLASDFSLRGVGEANVLIVTAPPQYLSVINDIASKFVPSKISDTTIVKIIPLKYAWAYDMSFNYANGSISVPGISSLLQSIVTGQRLTTAFSPFNVNVGGAQQQIQYQQKVGMLDDTPPYAKDISNSIKNIQNRDNTPAQSEDKGGKTSEENVADISGSTLPGFITCDQRLNAIIIRDRRENMPFYEEIITKLDVPCEVIKIDVAIVNVNKNANRALGVNGIRLNYTGNRPFNTTVTTGGANPFVGNITGTLGVIPNVDITAALDALEKNGAGQTISKPSVLTLDNVAAILETDKIRYATVTGVNNSNAYTQTASTKLQVVPHIIPGDIDENNKRKMKLFVDISDGNFEVDANQVTQHSLNTQAVLYEGQSLLIGGYNTEINQKSNGGIPILKDIPLIGAIFRHSSNEKAVRERIYVVSPCVVEIRSDDDKYKRFLQPAQLTANPSLYPEEYPLTAPWPRNKTRQPSKWKHQEEDATQDQGSNPWAEDGNGDDLANPESSQGSTGEKRGSDGKGSDSRAANTNRPEKNSKAKKALQKKRRR